MAKLFCMEILLMVKFFILFKKMFFKYLNYFFLVKIVKLTLPFIKYCISLVEMFVITHYEIKTTIFSVLDFIFTSKI